MEPTSSLSSNFGFEGEGLVPVVWPPDDSAGEPERDDGKGVEAMVRLVTQLIQSANSAEDAGRKLFIIGHMFKVRGFSTQWELADKMKLSPGRVSQILSKLKTANGGGTCDYAALFEQSQPPD